MGCGTPEPPTPPRHLPGRPSGALRSSGHAFGSLPDVPGLAHIVARSHPVPSLTVKITFVGRERIQSSVVRPLRQALSYAAGTMLVALG